MSTSPITDEGISIVIELCGFGHPTATLPRTVVEGMVNRIRQQEEELQLLAECCVCRESGHVHPKVPITHYEPFTVSGFREWAHSVVEFEQNLE